MATHHIHADEAITVDVVRKRRNGHRSIVLAVEGSSWTMSIHDAGELGATLTRVADQAMADAMVEIRGRIDAISRGSDTYAY